MDNHYSNSGKDNPFISCTRGIPEIMTGFGPVEFTDEEERITLCVEEFDIVERWSLADEGSQLPYELTVVDPEHFVKPLRQTKTWRGAPDQKVHPCNCEQSQ